MLLTFFLAARFASST